MTASLFPSNKSQIDSICIGSGRFLRAVLVPALIACNMKPVIIQTRGRTFMNYCSGRGTETGADNDVWAFEVDTVEHDGTIQTDEIPCYGAGTLGTEEGKAQVIELLTQLKNLKMVGVGVTEAGLSSSSTKAMRDLFDILSKLAVLFSEQKIQCDNPNGKVCIVNTDNVSQNGDTLGKFMKELSSQSDDEVIQKFLEERVVFHNSMVDRITSQRPDSGGLIPRAEPTPAKALVVEDLKGDLPTELLTKTIKDKFGVVVRSKEGQLNADIALKLRVANGTHTAVAHVMALCRLLMTDVLSSSADDDAILLMKYLDSFFEGQIRSGVEVTDSFEASAEDAEYVYDDWRRRLIHAHFGLSAFFITQNGAAKGGIRIAPTVIDLVNNGRPVSCSTVFAFAAILRFLTPADSSPVQKNGVYRGWLDKEERNEVGRNIEGGSESTTVYADGLAYNLEEGWYEFRCGCNVAVEGLSDSEKPLPELLGLFPNSQQPVYYEKVIRSYLLKEDGGDLSKLAGHPRTKDTLTKLVKAVSVVYARMVSGDGMLDLLKELSLDNSMECLIDGVISKKALSDYQPLYYRDMPIPDESMLMKAKLGEDREAIKDIVFSEVASAPAIDLHTHLLPPSHGALCLWGIDELLSYHYLVAEYFMTAPTSISPSEFYEMNKAGQADLIWEALFVDRTPISEACRGVISTMVGLGLREEVESRDLTAIRRFYKKFRDEGVAGAEEFSKLVYLKSGIRYSVMTNIPFDPTETLHWKPKPKDYSSNYRSACRVDPLLAGDSKTIKLALAASGYDDTVDGAKKYLHEWCDIMKPEYMMASTPHNFVLREENSLNKGEKFGVNEAAMKTPFAFTDLTSNNCGVDCGEEDGFASVVDENCDYLSEVLMKVCEERDLPIALKIGAHRGVNPTLQQAGDGVVAFADANMLARLCSRFPNVRFLATFLSRNNQHEACVLATKFRNLHIYGCWWFCNNPSIIHEITQMRIEMLGTAFTAQHSDSRVLDQLIYKWAHSRGVIANVLAKEISKLVESGWRMSRGELRRDVRKLFGGSYEEFMSKSFIKQSK